MHNTPDTPTPQKAASGGNTSGALPSKKKTGRPRKFPIGTLKTTGYALELHQIDALARRAKHYKTSGSAVLRDIINRAISEGWIS